ncbi:hypothetical protein NVP1170O_194 [Vibrio phage 1.170.O._10N.261.52.C3]|nr:hypothetical protein NVP1170O_194 [Vibrio phage 1.170.O._10N.261.52.C3]
MLKIIKNLLAIFKPQATIDAQGRKIDDVIGHLNISQGGDWTFDEGNGRYEDCLSGKKMYPYEV